MAWFPIPDKPDWEYSTDPNLDKKPIDHYDYDNDAVHTQGKKKFAAGEKYVLARQMFHQHPGYGELYVKDPAIKALFDSRTGIWYDPQDLTTMYQDAQGTLPVYRPGSGLVDPPVGLMLDKHQGLELGPELAIDTAPNFRVYRTATESVSYTVTSPGAILVGKTYKWEIKISANVGVTQGDTRTQWLQQVAQTSIPAGYNGTITGYSIIISATNQSESLFTINGSNTGTDFVVDNVSIREIKGYHAYQNTTLARPTLSGRYNLLTGTETLATQTIPTVTGATYTLSFTGTGTITLSGAATGVKSAGTHTITATSSSLTCTVAGTVTKADLRVANDGVSLPSYQRVTSATNYDTNGFPLYLRFDGVDDKLNYNIGESFINANLYMAAYSVPISGKVTLSAGGNSIISIQPLYAPKYFVGLSQYIVIGGSMTPSEHLVSLSYINRVLHKTDEKIKLGEFRQYFLRHVSLTEVSLDGFEPLGGLANLDAMLADNKLTQFIFPSWKYTWLEHFIRENPLLTTIDFSAADMSILSTAYSIAPNCPNLTTLIVGNAFDNTPCTNFKNAFLYTNLNQESIDAILVSINNAGTSNGTFNQSGGSAPSATGQAAITAMRSRGWTVTVTGGF